MVAEANVEAGSTVLARDGTALFMRHWPERAETPGAGTPDQAWGRLLIVHGIGEHSGRYERTAGVFAANGLDVHAFDLRGHGRSGGRRVYVERWDVFLDDLAERLEALRSPEMPALLLGHSMGALIALTYTCSGRPAPDLLVLSAPPLGASVPALTRFLAPILSRIAPRFVVSNPIAGSQLSRDPAVGEAYFADPLVQPRSTARLGAELLAAMPRARAALRGLRVPTLVIHGGDDRLVPAAVSEPLAGLPGVERRVLPGLRHETLNEPEGPEVAAAIAAWLRAKVAAAGSPADPAAAESPSTSLAGTAG